MPFDLVDAATIRAGDATDAYFDRALAALDVADRDPTVTAAVTADQLPTGRYLVLAGVSAVAELLEPLGVTVDALPPGRIVDGGPLMQITGRYRSFARYETAIIGLLSQASAMATAALRVRLAAPDTPVYSFGARHVHPAIAPVVERSALIAGLDGISHVAAGHQLGVDPVGTMPHALMLCFGRDAQPAAWVAFDEAVDDAVPRIALCDTFDDEVTEVRAAVETLGERLEAVRLDTTHSRRGDFAQIITEVRWHLDDLGAADVDIFVSGGLGPAECAALAPHVDGFGVGGAITGARPLDIALDLVAVDGAAVSKRGKLPGPKQLYRHADGTHTVARADADAPAAATPLLEPLLADGTPTAVALDWEAAAARCAADVEAVGLDGEQLRR